MSKVTLLGDTSGKVELAAPNSISPNLIFILPSEDGSAGQVLSTDGFGVLSFVSNDGTLSFAKANAAYDQSNTATSLAQLAYNSANNAAISSIDSTARNVANAAYNQANTSNTLAQAAFDAANTATSGAIDVYARNTANTLFDGTSQATVNTLTANTITSVNVISSNTVTANNLTVTGVLNVDGVILQWHTPVPLTSKGDPGDVPGLISIDNDKLYRCVGTYDGTTDIWRFINFTGGTWG